MNRSIISATIVAGVLASLVSSSNVYAQRQHNGIAVIDIAQVFKNHPRFSLMEEELKTTVKQAEDEIKQRRDELLNLDKQQQEFQKGTPEFKRLDEQMISRKADMEVFVKVRRKEVVEREAKMYYTIYLEILDEVKWFAEQNGIDLVLRISEAQNDLDDPRAVMMEIQKPVVYKNAGIDITPHITQQLQRRQPAGPVGQRPQGPRVPQRPQ